MMTIQFADDELLADDELAAMFAEDELLGSPPHLARTAQPGEVAGGVDEDYGPSAASRGIVVAVILSAPFWVVLGVTFYFLV